MRLMEKRGWGPTDLGNLLRVHKSTVQFWLDRGAPPVGWVRHIAAVMRLDVDTERALMATAVLVEERKVDAQRGRSHTETEVRG